MRSFTKFVLEQLLNSDSINSNIKNFFMSSKPAYIYGGGNQCKILMDMAQYFEKKIEGLLLSPGGKVLQEFYRDLPVYFMDNIPESINKDNDVIIAVNPRYNAEIIDTLKEKQFYEIFSVNSWESLNEDLRDLWYNSYFDYHNFTKHNDANGVEYLQYSTTDIDYKFYFPKDDEVVRSNLASMLNDILLPALLDDTHYVCEGPYEHGHVKLEKGDVVFDCGANFGVFSGIAAAKGCSVYAFEPAPFTLEILNKFLSFYNNASVHALAISNKDGTTTFQANDDKSLVLNSMLEEKHHNVNTIEVQTTSIDAFIEANSITKLDFIKADIEGAERLMLQGAQQTLARFAPKLALCTYHLPDDPQVMEKLILQANPRYIIEHKWSKLFAYCPR